MSALKEREYKKSSVSPFDLDWTANHSNLTGFLTIPKPNKGANSNAGQMTNSGDDPGLSMNNKDSPSKNSNPAMADKPEEKQIKLKKSVDLFSGIALIVGTMIGMCPPKHILITANMS